MSYLLKMKSYFCFITLVWWMNDVVQGNDPFEGLLPGPHCFTPLSITGCDKTLLESFTPKSKGIGGNQPDTKFFLFTLKNPENPENLHDCGGKLPEGSNFNPLHRTEILVHGWLDGTCRTAWMREMRDQLFMRGTGEYNVILVDWTWGNTPDYAAAASNNKAVGEQIAFVVNNILEQTNSSGNMFHIIGHSFGSHIAGFAGKAIPNLRRITALDPAMSPYTGQPPENRLYRTDARIVDAIHTSATDCFLFGIGYKEPIGDADFYPNGGSDQRMNAGPIVQAFLKLNYLWGTLLLLSNFYNHLMAVDYYKASINPCGHEFVGVECSDYQSFERGNCNSCGQDGSNCAVMGMNFELYNHKRDNRNHSYYLDTGLICPFYNNEKVELDGFSLKRVSESCDNTAHSGRNSRRKHLFHG